MKYHIFFVAGSLITSANAKYQHDTRALGSCTCLASLASNPLFLRSVSIVTNMVDLESFLNQKRALDINQGQEKRDNVAILLDSSPKDVPVKTYASLDSDDPSISAEERLLRLASAFYHTGIDKGNWVRKWASAHAVLLAKQPMVARAIIAYAFDARYGSIPSPAEVQWIRNFDTCYRKLNDLPAEFHDDLNYLSTRGPGYGKILSSFRESMRFSERMKSDVGWKTYT